MSRRGIVLSVCALALALVAGARAVGGAASAVRTRACPQLGANWRCRTLVVPLDRSGRTPGTVRLAVAEWHRPGPRRAAVMAFSGGPGGAGIPGAARYRALLKPLLGDRDLILFDQRGTGVSAPLSCPRISGRETFPTAAVRACGRRLGARGAYFSSADSAADAEAVRRALGSPRVVLYGVSYGTKTAADYARRYPRAVRGMVLDSVVVQDTDPLYRRSAVAAARILRELCTDVRCATDPVRDLTRIIARMRDGALRARVARRSVDVTEARLLAAIVAGGATRRRLPAALHAAASGRFGPLAAVLPAVIPDLRGDPWLRASFSATTYLATTCEDASFPWRASDSYATRGRKAAAWLARQRSAAYAPFDKHVAASYGSTRMCRAWPSAHERSSAGPLPDVPALLLSGAEDALTPLEGAREVAAELPRARLVVVPGRGHVVLGTTGLAARALALWARGIG